MLQRITDKSLLPLLQAETFSPIYERYYACNIKLLWNKDDDNLELFTLHASLRQVIKGAFGIDHVANREGGNKKKLICPCTKTYIQFKLIKGKELTLRCLPRLDKHTEKEKKSPLVLKFARKPNSNLHYCQHSALSIICNKIQTNHYAAMFQQMGRNPT